MGKRDVGDAVVGAHEPVAAGQTAFEHVQQPLGLRNVAVARALVLVVLAGELMEEAELAEHRSDAAHLEHQPLEAFVAAGGILRNEAAGLLGQVHQDRTRLEQRQRLAAGTVWVEDGRDLVVRVDRQEGG